MKLLGYFFSIYLLIISCMPCSDKEEKFVYRNHATISQTENSPGNREHSEGCSPFCTCVCCGYYASFNPLPTTEKWLWFYKKEKLIPLAGSHSHGSYYGNIWQPPKLS